MTRTSRTASVARKLFAPGLVALAVATAVALGVWLQYGERIGADTRHTAGSGAADRVDITTSVQKVDAAARQLTLRVLVTPRGGLAEAGGLSPARDLVLQTSSAVRGDLSFPAHSRIATAQVPVTLTDGSITDYPFDSYRTALEFSAEAGGREVPVRMSVSNNDALFAVNVRADTADGAAVFDLNLERSSSVFLFALFMMAAMWALAVGVLVATWFLLSGRKGLVWPALGWMAATLFALAAFRNTAPGAPPIGCLLDYLAFLWVEPVIAFCVFTVVVAGVRAEPRAEEAAG
ncbi:DUF4436 family protein [Streptomyces sp. NA04227]|uniref:DUF4436 family protein n=1 Tax=Streptomyces sp. NA04227 TaxID=2742136 RepID=UPI00158FE2F8|nr:DUF4436 family protein [Streptomyces sp. NA04227]QKW09842.1 DUF4436 family protein [Streptomyces sp. NA04227]